MALSFCTYIIKINVVNVLVDCWFTSCRSSTPVFFLFACTCVSLRGIDLIDRLVMVKVGPESIKKGSTKESLSGHFAQNLKVTEINELENSAITNLLFVIYLTAQQSLMTFTVITTC